MPRSREAGTLIKSQTRLHQFENWMKPGVWSTVKKKE
ncbi:hypothetical protein NPIL_470431, partial [Nephila pilipes]